MALWPSRRTFLKTGLAVTAVGAAGAGGYYLSQDKVRLALVGCGVRGTALGETISKSAWLYHRCGDVRAVCDVDRTKTDAIRQKFFSSATPYDDYRKVLERPDIDGVIVSTCDHWHAGVATHALQAGKAVYCEKPLTHTLAEGSRLVHTVQETGRPLLVGTQQRNDGHFRTACELVRAGRIGKVHQVNVTLSGKGLRGGPFPTVDPPEGLNWDFWLGPAPAVGYCPERHRRWPNWWEYGGGELTAWGTHHIDIAMWALGEPWSGPIKVAAKADLPDTPGGYNTPVDFTIDYVLSNGTPLRVQAAPPQGHPDAQSGVEFEGEKSTLWASRVELRGPAVDELHSNPLKEAPLHANPAVMQRTTVHHMRHFLDCIRGESTPVSDVASGHRTSALCHIGNISVRLGRPLQWDPATERFINDAEADALLDYDMRKTYL